MAKQLYTLTVRGRRHEWSFNVRLNPEFQAEWLEDGLDINVVLNEIPFWVVQLGLEKPWCWLQDHGIIPL